MTADMVRLLSDIRANYNCMDEKEEPYYRALSEAIRIVAEQRWIPVSERLPELCNRNDGYSYSYSDYIILCDSIEDMCIGNYALDDGKKEGYFTTTDCDEFVPEAWMPLPEPYKGDDNEQT